jgi:hypothetical protein
VGDHHHLREKPIRTRVGGIADKVERPGEHAIGAKQSYEIVAQALRRPLSQALWSAIALRRAIRQTERLRVV